MTRHLTPLGAFITGAGIMLAIVVLMGGVS